MVPLAVSGVQAKLLDEPRSGILSGGSAKTGLAAEAAMAAPATSPTHFAPRALNLRKDFGINDEFICSLMAIRQSVFQAGRRSYVSPSTPNIPNQQQG